MRDKVLEKIRKLMEHAASAEKIGSFEEAKAFGAKLQAMLDRHNLKMGDVELHALRSEPIEMERLSFIQPGDMTEHVQLLVAFIAGINGCRVLGDGHSTVVIAGKRQDRRVAAELCRFYLEVLRRLAAEFERESAPAYSGMITITLGGVDYRLPDSPNASEMFYGMPMSRLSKEERLRGFLHGVVTGICSKLQEAHQASRADNTNPEALVYLDNRMNDVTSWMRDQVPGVQDVEVDLPPIDRESFEKGCRVGREAASSERTLGLSPSHRN